MTASKTKDRSRKKGGGRKCQKKKGDKVISLSKEFINKLNICDEVGSQCEGSKQQLGRSGGT